MLCQSPGGIQKTVKFEEGFNAQVLNLNSPKNMKHSNCAQ